MTLRAATGYVPLNDPSTCEMCGTVTTAANTHSIKMVYAMPGAGTTAYQCVDEQHYACCEEHALLAALACYFAHIKTGTFVGKGVANVEPNYISIMNTVNGYVVANLAADPTLP